MNKSQVLALSLIALAACSLCLITNPVKATTSITNYNLGFVQTSFTQALSNNLIIEAKDAINNTITTYSGTVNITCSDAYAILPSNPLTITNGIGTCTLHFGSAGSQTLTVTDNVDTAITGTTSVTVAPIHFNVSVLPASIIEGSSVNVTVTALDASDNVLTDLGNQGYGSSLSFASTDAQASFPADGIPTRLTSGTGIFNVILRTPGSQTITVINKAFPLVNATTSTITVNSTATATPSPSPSPTPSPSSTPSASPTATVTPTATATDDLNQTNANSLFFVLIIVAVIAAAAVSAIVAMLVLKKKGKL